MTAKVILIQGLAYGDEGKGSTVDYLTRRENASMVVRFNGGAQAAHNVVTSDGQEHTFSQFGSGTLAGADTFLSEYMIVNPLYAINEAEHLESLTGCDPFDQLYVDEGALVTTPYHVATNRLKELLRGLANRHGSCGMGIGETVEDTLIPQRHQLVLRVEDLKDTDKLICTLRKLRNHRTQLWEKRAEKLLRTPIGEQVERELTLLRSEPEEYLDRYKDFCQRAHITNHSTLANALEGDGCVVFEGAQGVLIDQDYGFQPYTTWSRCTWQNADQLLMYFKGERQYLGVIRSYMTRHGHGPLVTEDASLEHTVHQIDHNKANLWQRGFRCGQFDPIALRYAIGVLGRVDGLVVTHMDTLEKFDCGVQVCEQYQWDTPFVPYAGEGLFTTRERRSDHIDIPLTVPSFERQSRVSYYLDKANPLYNTMSATSVKFISLVEKRLKVPVVTTSHGPTADDKRET